jgi:flagellar hook-basal body complex protein FliE
MVLELDPQLISYLQKSSNISQDMITNFQVLIKTKSVLPETKLIFQITDLNISKIIDICLYVFEIDSSWLKFFQVYLLDQYFKIHPFDRNFVDQVFALNDSQKIGQDLKILLKFLTIDFKDPSSGMLLEKVLSEIDIKNPRHILSFEYVQQNLKLNPKDIIKYLKGLPIFNIKMFTFALVLFDYSKTPLILSTNYDIKKAQTNYILNYLKSPFKYLGEEYLKNITVEVVKDFLRASFLFFKISRLLQIKPFTNDLKPEENVPYSKSIISSCNDEEQLDNILQLIFDSVNDAKNVTEEIKTNINKDFNNNYLTGLIAASEFLKSTAQNKPTEAYQQILNMLKDDKLIKSINLENENFENYLLIIQRLLKNWDPMTDTIDQSIPQVLNNIFKS